MYRLEPPYRMDRRQKAGVENPYDGRREDQGDSGIARRPLLLFTAVGLLVWESEMCRKSISIDRITTSSERQSDVIYVRFFYDDWGVTVSGLVEIMIGRL